MLGSLSVSHDSPREWTRYDVAIVEETAERTWAAVERANVEATLKAREAQLAFLDEISQLMAVAEPEGKILDRISERIAAQLGLTHCTFLDVDSARGLVTTTFGWQANEPVRAMARTYRMADYMTRTTSAPGARAKRWSSTTPRPTRAPTPRQTRAWGSSRS